MGRFIQASPETRSGSFARGLGQPLMGTIRPAGREAQDEPGYTFSTAPPLSTQSLKPPRLRTSL